MKTSILRTGGSLVLLLFYAWAVFARRADDGASAEELRALAEQSRTSFDAGRSADALAPTLTLHHAHPANLVYLKRLARIYGHLDYNLCRSLTDLRSKVLARSRKDRPIFAYTQPQNIHISVMTRAGSSAATGAAHPGFHAPYASRLHTMDACFGEFVQFLRDEGLYDDSVIVLTSDHGDSLGEGGRWGHAYTIFPEILRIPLVVHLPRAWRQQVTCDTDAVASLVDITPTLYDLLGHRPVASRAMFGRPLCTETPQERIATRRDSYMVVSSYGPVYGILKGNGRWLYIADGVNYTDYYYDLADDPAGLQNRVTAAVRGEYQPLIREGIEEINRFYRR